MCVGKQSRQSASPYCSEIIFRATPIIDLSKPKRGIIGICLENLHSVWLYAQTTHWLKPLYSYKYLQENKIKIPFFRKDYT